MNATRGLFSLRFQHEVEACKSLYPGSIPGEASKNSQFHGKAAEATS
jgi:hypothetical protein